MTPSLPCPLCAGATHAAFDKAGFTLRDCVSCGHRFAAVEGAGEAHVARVYGDDYFEGGGGGYLGYLAEGRIVRNQGRRYARIVARHRSPGRVLDVGAAAGFLLQGFCDAGWSGRGLEPNAKMAEHARRTLGLDVVVGTLENLNDDRRYDLVSFVQVLPHLYDVRRALAAAAEVTAPGGFWLVETWNRASVTARLFGPSWHEYNPPSVVHWFTPEGVSRVVAPFGMQLLARGRPAKWISARHAKSQLRHALGTSVLGRLAAAPLAVIPDGLSVPYPAEDLFWMLFRKS